MRGRVKLLVGFCRFGVVFEYKETDKRGEAWVSQPKSQILWTVVSLWGPFYLFLFCFYLNFIAYSIFWSLWSSMYSDIEVTSHSCLAKSIPSFHHHHLQSEYLLTFMFMHTILFPFILISHVHHFYLRALDFYSR